MVRKRNREHITNGWWKSLLSALHYVLGRDFVHDDADRTRALYRQSAYRRIWVVVAACLYYSGLVPLVRWRRNRTGRNLLILGYHRASDNLRRHVRYLQRYYRIIPLETALEELYGLRKDDLRQADSRPPLVLTFDDGYYDNYTDAFALARELRFPFTIFVCPGYIDGARRFWWFEAKHLVDQAHVRMAVIDGHRYHLDNRTERDALAHAIDMRLHSAPSVAQREAFLAYIREALGVGTSISQDELARPLSWPEMHEMEASGWVSYGSHTVHHPVLSCLRDPAEIQRELSESRSILERQLGHPVRAVAYPIGTLEAIGDAGISAAREAGYQWAITVLHGRNTPYTDPHILRRELTDTGEHWLVMAAQAGGVWTLLSPTHALEYVQQLITRVQARRRALHNRSEPPCIVERLSGPVGVERTTGPEFDAK